ncbi:MAG: hypothetical protein LBL72_07780 [Candidatus Accumulibacter sp.]|jgi:hypothetical protein|nr:hypothetical protein [Accumulibacter sp.]
MFVPRLKAADGKSKEGAARRLGKPPSSLHSSTELDKLKTFRFYPALRNRGRGIRKIGNSQEHGVVKYRAKARRRAQASSKKVLESQENRLQFQAPGLDPIPDRIPQKQEFS